MTSTPLIPAIFALLGVLLGGGLQAYMQYRARKAEAAAVLQALLTEVDALVRLAQHRQYLANIVAHRNHCQHLVDHHQSAEQSPMFVLDLSLDYFKTYDALIPKIGMLDPWYADRITRFYLFSKSVVQNYLPTSPFQNGMNAEEGLLLFSNDIPLLETALRIGDGLSKDRKIVRPKGATDSTVAFDTPNLPLLPIVTHNQAPNSGPSSSG